MANARKNGSWKLSQQPDAREDIEVWRTYLRTLRAEEPGEYSVGSAIELAEFVVSEKLAGRLPTVPMSEQELRAAKSRVLCPIIDPPMPFASLAVWQEFLKSLENDTDYDWLTLEMRKMARKTIAELSMRGVRE